MLEAVVFDLDGTLLDTAPDLHAAAEHMLSELGRPTLTLNEITAYIGNGVKPLVAGCLQATGGLGDDLDAALALFSKHYTLQPARLSRANPGLPSALAEMRAGGLRLGVCTNKPQGLAEAILRHFEFLPLFSAIVGGDGVRALKPDPEPLLHCLKLLESSVKSALYVGDSEVDEETATRAALRFALFSGGYRKKSAADMRTSLVFDGFDELARWALTARGAGLRR